MNRQGAKAAEHANEPSPGRVMGSAGIDGPGVRDNDSVRVPASGPPHRSWLGLLVIAVLHLTIRVWVFSGIQEPDDLFYSEAAHRFSKGEFVQPWPWGLRYPLIVPLAASQRILGINEWSLKVPPMLYSLAALFLVYLLASTYGKRRVGLAAAGLWALFPLDIVQATELHLDLPMTVFLCAGVYMLVQGERMSRGVGQTSVFLGSGLAWGLAHLAKEVAVVLAGVLVVRIWWRRCLHVEYAWFVVGFALILGLELGWFTFTTGEPWYRFSQRVWKGHIQAMAIPGGPPYMWMLQYVDMLMNPLNTHAVYLGGFFYPVLAGSVWGWRMRNEAVRELTLWWMTILVLFNFAPSDLTFRHPLFTHYARTLHPMFVPGLIIAAFALVDAVSTTSKRLTAVVCLVLLSLASVWTSHLHKRLWGETARRVFHIARSAGGEVLIVTDPMNRAQLTFFFGYRTGIVKGFEEASMSDASRPTLWLYDPFWIDWARRELGRSWMGGIGPPDPPLCPELQIKHGVLPSVVERLVPKLVGVVFGADHVVRRWQRDPARLFVCGPRTDLAPASEWPLSRRGK